MEIVHGRINRYLWLALPPFLAMCGLMAMLPFQMAAEDPKTSPYPAFIFFGLGALGGFGLAIYLVRSFLFEEVIASGSELRWRGAFGTWKSVRWEEISDFYLSGVYPTVQTPHGKLKIASELTHRKELMAVIAARATSAPAREWEDKKYRAAQGFTERFVYWSKSQKWMMPLVSFLLFGSVAGLIAINYSERKENVPIQYFLSPWPIAVLFVCLFGTIALLGLIAPYIMWRDRKVAFQRRYEFLEVSPFGLLWADGQRQIRVGWDEICAIKSAPGRGVGPYCDYLIETASGNFRVYKTLDRMELWLQLVMQFAPQIAPPRETFDPDLGDEASTWSGGKVSVGVRVFHFRTRDTRLVLIALTAFGLILPLIPLIYGSMQSPDDVVSTVSPQVWQALLVIGAVVTCYSWACFGRAAIRVQETGLEWRVPLLPTRRVRWSEIEALGRDEWACFIQTRGQKLRLWRVSTPVRHRELLQLITERATNATGHFD